jgi:hypothetical protein
MGPQEMTFRQLKVVEVRDLERVERLNNLNSNFLKHGNDC